MSGIFSIGNDELKNKREVHKGDVFLHTACGEMHELQCFTNQDGTENQGMLWFQCGKKQYIAAIDNRWLYD